MTLERSRHWLQSRITNLEVELEQWKQATFDWEGRARTYQSHTVKLKKEVEELEDKIRDHRTG